MSALWERAPGRLWSLWDMLEFKAASFYGVTSALHKLQHNVESGIARGIEEHLDGSLTINFITDHVAVEYLSQQVLELKKNVITLGLPMTLKSVEKLDLEVSSERGFVWERVGELCSQVHERLLDELSLIKLFVLNAQEQEFFEPSVPLFDENFALKFKTEGVFEVDEAAKCLALGRPTAAVFHLMRTMEVAIRSVARCLQIADPLKPAERNWGFILKKINDGLIGKWPNTTDRASGDGELFESLYASLEAVRNPWRNATMHVEKKYTEDEAKHIFIAVKGFMRRLASRCDEEGNPKA